MSVLDEINERYRRGAMWAGSVPRPTRLGDASGNDEPVLHDAGGPALDRLCPLRVALNRVSRIIVDRF